MLKLDILCVLKEKKCVQKRPPVICNLLKHVKIKSCEGEQTTSSLWIFVFFLEYVELYKTKSLTQLI